jgi:undecaprenyl pyrophosphate phosphatase UppP
VSAILLVITTVDISIIPDVVMDELTERQAQAVAFSALSASIVALVIMFFVQRLFTNIHASDAVFTDGNAKDLRSLAIMIVVAAVVMMIVTGITYLIDPSPIINGSSTLMFLLLAFIVYILSLIFQHGAELQRQSDETL